MSWWWKKADPTAKVKVEESPKLKKVKVRQTEDERPLRAQLVEAQARLQREIEILGSSSVAGFGGGPPNNRSEIATLEAELSEIEAALANLAPDEP